MAEKGITKTIDYEALLRQAVNVLEQAEKSISRHIAHSVICRNKTKALPLLH